MEFDTGPDVQPGHDISISGSSGSTDLGAATYDSDHDGVADSVIVIEDDHEYVITDSDHDGHADSIHAYDENGNQVDPKTGAPIDGSGDGTTGGSSDGTTGTDTGASTTDHTGSSTTGASTDGTQTGSSSDAGSDITVTGSDGSAHSIGTPTVDLDHDGSPDTAVVHNSDGSVTGYTDRDGDGHADQITQIGADGKVVIAVADNNGGWTITTTGHLDASGNLVPDGTPNPDASLDPADTAGVTSGHTTTSGTATGASDHTTSGQTTSEPTGDGRTVAEPVPNSAPISGNEPDGDITFSEDGKDYDLGHPTTDLDGDGTPDTVVTHLADGTVVGYTDTDGDGTADQITQISAGGQVVIGVSDGHGGWTQAATGHMGADGKFVPDSSAAATTG
ncbi:hypothetical protein SAMN04515671_1977 [Nakamurella panacisegetis]|uniref:DUF6802 domain-containing protein n=1 Tax=Nakamurella panacisegetis TaxID=1090615 RepID=A0A1H0MCM8_9ACTN|nr:DUF6802 family protein [Nakamurella panacisegetis]SDO78172.1 hypothetical protein SAMN04515671_1977 [Nakamurella panacisegetis]